MQLRELFLSRQGAESRNILFGLEAYQQGPRPFQDWPLDHGGLGQHQADRLVPRQIQAVTLWQFPERCAGPVQQGLPPHLVSPGLQLVRAYPLGLVVVKHVAAPIRFKPLSRLGHGVAGLDAKKGQGHVGKPESV